MKSIRTNPTAGAPEGDERLDPVCAFHGLRRSEHHCLYCCICFETLTPDECAVDAEGVKWDICLPCSSREWANQSAATQGGKP